MRLNGSILPVFYSPLIQGHFPFTFELTDDHKEAKNVKVTKKASSHRSNANGFKSEFDWALGQLVLKQNFYAVQNRR